MGYFDLLAELGVSIDSFPLRVEKFVNNFNVCPSFCLFNSRNCVSSQELFLPRAKRNSGFGHDFG